MSSGYRDALTRKLANQLGNNPQANIVVQLGAYINTRQIYGPDALLASYQDGNVVEKFKSDFTHPALRRDKNLYKEVFEYEKRVAESMDWIFTTSEYLRHSFIDDYGISPKKVVNVKIGVNLSEYSDVLEKPKDYSKREILFIGKSEFKRKGGDILVHAFAKIRKKYPNSKLHIVGIEKPPSKEFDISGVQYYGILDKENSTDLTTFKQLLIDSSIFVLPSRFEPLGIAPIEAMMHRIPAVVTGEWALKENVIDGKTGLHCLYNDADDLAQKIDLLFSKPSLCEDLGNKAREWAKVGFTWKDVVDRMVATLSP
jgi:glycosyltransferase involved in cell wall biosynthesis